MQNKSSSTDTPACFQLQTTPTALSLAVLAVWMKTLLTDDCSDEDHTNSNCVRFFGHWRIRQFESTAEVAKYTCQITGHQNPHSKNAQMGYHQPNVSLR